MANIHSFGDLEIGRGEQPNSSSNVPDSLWGSMTRVFCPKFSYRTITFALIVTNIVLFLALGLISWLTSIPYNCVLYYVGALYPPDIKHFHLHRLLMPAFLHFDIMHILTNTLSTFILSFEPEDSLGRTRFLILYFGSSLYGFILSCVASPYSLTVGASAAIMGLFGYYIVRMVFKTQQMDNRSYGIFLCLLCLNLFFIFTSPTGNLFAHLGGLVFGGLYMLTLTEEREQEYPDIERWKKWAKYGLIAYPIIAVLGFMLRRIEYEPIC